MERVIGSDIEALGVLLNEEPHGFPGLTPVSQRLSSLGSRVAELEAAEYELKQIRATLLLNYGDTPHNRHSLRLVDAGKTITMMMSTLRHLESDSGVGSKPPEGKEA